MEHCLECKIDTKKKKGQLIPVKEGSLFCLGCQPKASIPPPYPMSHGYYIPALDKRFGNGQASYEAKAIYDSFKFPKACNHKDCAKGQECPNIYYKFASRYDGVSVFFRDNNTLVKRVCVQNIFSEQAQVVALDYPFK